VSAAAPRPLAHVPSAEGCFRPGRVIQVLAEPSAGARASSQTLYGPQPVDAAKALCQQLARAPDQLRILDVPAQGFALQVVAPDGQVLAFVGVDPPTPKLAGRLAEALAGLAFDRWFP
jgi:hypothetical protein